eukprot:3545192-Heterocapsa_arctica.AAC.1
MTNAGNNTCFSPTSAKEYDFFAASEAITRMLKVVEVMSGAALAPHPPVSMSLHPGGSKLRHLVYRSALPLPRHSPFGPAPRPQDWTPAGAAAD